MCTLAYHSAAASASGDVVAAFDLSAVKKSPPKLHSQWKNVPSSTAHGIACLPSDSYFTIPFMIRTKSSMVHVSSCPGAMRMPALFRMSVLMPNRLVPQPCGMPICLPST